MSDFKTRQNRAKAVLPPATLNGNGVKPPSDVEVEAAVLGALILEPHVASMVFDRLSVDSFFLEKHQLVFAACLALYNKSKPIDMLTVRAELANQGKLDLVGGAFFVAELTNGVVSSAHVEYHAMILLEKQVLRGVLRLSAGTYQQAIGHNVDALDLVEDLQSGAMQLINGIARKEAKSAAMILPGFLKQLQEIQSKTPGLTGLPSGFSNIDLRFGGFKPGKLYVIAARPAMGKTAFMLNILLNAAKLSKKPVAIFSLEMDEQEIVSRLLASESSVPGKRILDGDLEGHEWHSISKASAVLEKHHIFIDDTSGLKMFELRAKARRLVAKEGVAMIAIDYLQLMSGDGQNHNREQQISEISRGLKTLAMELKIPVLALSQLSRMVESRGGDKRPQLQDLRESGAIEQDADAVCFLYRPEYYEIDQKKDGTSTKGLVEVITRKLRGGEPGSDELYFRGASYLFTESAYQATKADLPF